jgi:hypothetical protein
MAQSGQSSCAHVCPLLDQSGHAADMAVFFSYLRLHHVGFLAAAAILKEAAW